MKTIYIAILVMLSLMLMMSCEKQIGTYNTEQDMLNFDLGLYEEDSLVNYSFVYLPEEVKIDTVWCDIFILGHLSDQDRPFELEQVLSSFEDAVPGIHYVPFNDPRLKSFYYMPANKVRTKIPIVFKRDPSLKEKKFRLSLTFRDNGVFKKGFDELSMKSVDFTDKLDKPNNWNIMTEHYFGEYGPVKHMFMIEHSGDRWDDEYFIKVLGYDNSSSVDQTYLKHLSNKFQNILDGVNADRQKENLDLLKEDDGSTVQFTK